jgi:hypothetical protein
MVACLQQLPPAESQGDRLDYSVVDVAADGHRCDAGAVGPEHFRPSCLGIEIVDWTTG